MSDQPNLSDVQARRSEIAKTIEQLQAEDKELEIAERVLVRFATRSDATSLRRVAMPFSSRRLDDTEGEQPAEHEEGTADPFGEAVRVDRA